MAEDQDVPVLAGARQQELEQRRPVRGEPRLLGRHPLQLRHPRPLVQMAQVDPVPGNRERPGHELHRHSGPVVPEARAQLGVAAQRGLHRPPQPLRADRALEGEAELDGVRVGLLGVVGGVEQQAPLERGERQHVGERTRLGRQRVQLVLRQPGQGDVGG